MQYLESGNIYSNLLKVGNEYMEKVLFLCGYFENKYQEEIQNKTKTFVENAANIFQERLIRGLENQTDVKVVSAPFIGAWPKAYSDKKFTQFEDKKSENGNIKSTVHYVAFNNIWGIRNISRRNALKKEVDVFLKTDTDCKKVIIVYSPHTPLLEAAVYGKSKDKNIHISLIIPDLPQYMNLSKDRHMIYDFFKRIDIKRFKALNNYVDSYMVLTKYMIADLKIERRPHIVIEGIAKKEKDYLKKEGNTEKRIAFAGKLNESFGIKLLIDAFQKIQRTDVHLDICGGGELKEYIEDMCKKDNRIHYYGLVSAEQSFSILRRADILVNPRQNNEEYTKYSFPSKDIEYLLTGNIVIAYMLDGIPDIYKNFFLVPNDETTEALVETLEAALVEPINKTKERFCRAKQYLEDERNEYVVARKIMEMIRKTAN